MAAPAPEMRIGYIYKLACRDPAVTEIYVGSTCRVPDRRCEHRSRCNNANGKHYNLNVYQYIRANGGWGNFELLVVEQIDYNHKHELLLRERFHLEQLKATLNKVVPGRTIAEYRIDNKEVIRAKEAERYIDNKDAILAQYKIYRDNHKVEAAARDGVKHNCACGGKYTHGNMSKHAKTQKHRDYEAALPAAAAEVE